MQYFLYILAIPFLYLNYKIVVSDLKIKKIPNKYLGYLLLIIPFYYIYIFFSFPEINYLLFLLQIFLTFIISFILYYFNIWAAWDAKYLLVLSLFIPYIWIIPFIWNIALITIFYLFWYFIYFYLWKVLFNTIYRKNLWLNIKQDLSETWKVHKWNKWWNTYKIVAKFLIIFFIIFVSIRLIRIYLFNSFSSHLASPNGRETLFVEIIEKYNIYLIFLWIWVFIWWLYLFRLLINKFKIYINKKLNLNWDLIWNLLIWILFILLSSFISYELINNYNEISSLLFRVFTIYLVIYLIIKVLIYSYKITFGIGEYEYINIKDLKEGDVVDKNYLIKMFGKQSKLWYIYDKNSEKEKEMRKNKLLYPNPSIFFKKIFWRINIKEEKIIKKCYILVNRYHKKKKTLNYKKILKIRILNTFSFAPYIILWFLLTFFIKNKIFYYLINYLFNFIKNFY